MKTYPSRIDLIKELRPGAVGAEIGVYRADYSQQIMLETKVGHLYLVDPWTKQPNYNDTINLEDQEGHYQETLRKMGPFISGDKCTVIRGFSKEVAETHPEIPPLNFVIIDAYHEFNAALEDITVWSKRLAPFGQLHCHDFFIGPKYGHDGHEWRSGVVPAVEKFCAENGWEVTGVTTEDLPTAKLERKA